MAQNIALWDTTTGKLVNSGKTISGFFDQDFDVGGGGQSVFTVTQTFTGTSVIDIWVDGKLRREGGANDFTRNTGTNQVTLTFTAPSAAWVRIRVYP